MTKIKKFWIALITAILCLATFAFVGCNKGGGNTDGGDVFDDTKSYVFVIEDQDGNPLSGYNVYLCATAADGGACGPISKASNSNGKLTAVNPKLNGVDLGEKQYEIHLCQGSQSKPINSFTSAEASQNNGKYYTPLQYCTITLVVTL